MEHLSLLICIFLRFDGDQQQLNIMETVPPALYFLETFCKSKSEEYEEIWMVPRTLVYENVPKETNNLFIRQNLEKMIPVFVYLFFQNV